MRFGDAKRALQGTERRAKIHGSLLSPSPHTREQSLDITVVWPDPFFAQEGIVGPTTWRAAFAA